MMFLNSHKPLPSDVAAKFSRSKEDMLSTKKYVVAPVEHKDMANYVIMPKASKLPFFYADNISDFLKDMPKIVVNVPVNIGLMHIFDLAQNKKHSSIYLVDDLSKIVPVSSMENAEDKDLRRAYWRIKASYYGPNMKGNPYPDGLFCEGEVFLATSANMIVHRKTGEILFRSPVLPAVEQRSQKMSRCQKAFRFIRNLGR